MTIAELKVQLEHAKFMVRIRPHDKDWEVAVAFVYLAESIIDSHEKQVV